MEILDYLLKEPIEGLAAAISAQSPESSVATLCPTTQDKSSSSAAPLSSKETPMNTKRRHWKGIILASAVALLYSQGAGGAQVDAGPAAGTALRLEMYDKVMALVGEKKQASAAAD